MAEAILFIVAAGILNKLGSTTLQEIGLAADVRRDLKKLEETVLIVKVVLLDAEKKQSTSEGLRVWLGSLRDVLYDVDNILDAFEYKAIEQQLIKSKTKVHRFFKPSMFLFSFQMGAKIKKIRVRLDHIASDRAQFQLTERDVDRHAEPRETHSFVSPSYVIGRDIDQKHIVKLLTCTHIDLNLSVVPIVGIGGLRKTTIVKLVYNNIDVRECFELRMWVCVSDFDKQKLTKDITKSALRGVDCSGLSFDMLQTHLRETLEDKKFLLVLDDVWNEDQQQWIELQQLLISGAKGSKIIVTTRSHEVARIMGTTESYILRGLSNKDSWSLFVKCAFREGEEKNHQNLVRIGKDIIKKCKGVPLAVRSL